MILTGFNVLFKFARVENRSLVRNLIIPHIIGSIQTRVCKIPIQYNMMFNGIGNC